ncbi:MAG: hypothetical protein WBC93_10375 [Sulfitobacter sp.]
MSGASKTSEHVATGTGMIRSSPFGRLAVTLLVFMLLRFGFTLFSFPYPVFLAIAITVLMEVLMFWALRKRRSRRMAKAVSLQAELHDLKQQEFALRYQEAKESGKLDRFEKS